MLIARSAIGIKGVQWVADCCTFCLGTSEFTCTRHPGIVCVRLKPKPLRFPLLYRSPYHAHESVSYSFVAFPNARRFDSTYSTSFFPSYSKKDKNVVSLGQTCSVPDHCCRSRVQKKMIARLVLTPHRQVRAEFFDSLIQAQFNVMQNDGDDFLIYITKLVGFPMR